MNDQKIDYNAIAQERHAQIESSQENKREGVERSARDEQSTERVEHILQYFAYDHLPAHLQAVSAPFATLAQHIAATTPRNPERTTALRKLLESKDCAVRAVLAK